MTITGRRRLLTRFATSKQNKLPRHSRYSLAKRRQRRKPTGKMDVKGSGAITDLTDNLFIIWRNKARERALQRVQSGEKMSEKDEQLLASPASVLMLENNVTAKVGKVVSRCSLTSNRTSSCNLNQDRHIATSPICRNRNMTRRGDRKT